MMSQDELVALLREYNPNTNETMIRTAYDFAKHAHENQKRASGEPFFIHPLAVSKILATLRLDDITIATGLLHDTIEDTNTAYDEILRIFGSEIANLVDGVTNLKVKHSSDASDCSYTKQNAENLRKLLTVMARDIRVLLVKLADRLHNLRTIKHLPRDRMLRIARETMDIFSPLAERMGIQSIREELEDLCFDIINPEARNSIKRHFIHLKRQDQNIIATIEHQIISAMEMKQVQYLSIHGREKKPYSIWKKMEVKKIGFEQISDITAFRIIVAHPLECYQALGAVHMQWRSVPERYKDYISNPKINGYRSLHTTVVTHTGMKIEIQIRTQDMHDIAESGIATHWAYKDGCRINNQFSTDPYQWLRGVVQRLESGDDTNQSFEERARLEMMFDKIFCFTPRGDVIGCPYNSTVLDFAYAIHTDIGNTCIGAKLDGDQASPWRKVRNGQTIEVLCSENQHPEQHWREHVISARARNAINKALREREKLEFHNIGYKLIDHALTNTVIEHTDKNLRIACRLLNIPNVETLYIWTGQDISYANIVAEKLRIDSYPQNLQNQTQTYAIPPVNSQLSSDSPMVQIISGHSPRDNKSSLEDFPKGFHIAECCNPLPNERIVGIEEKDSLFIHSSDCTQLSAKVKEPYPWYDLAWHPHASRNHIYTSKIIITLYHIRGALGKICSLIALNRADIDNLHIISRNENYYTVYFCIEVTGKKHLDNIIDTLAEDEFVQHVSIHRI